MADMQGRGATWTANRIRLARKDEERGTRRIAIPMHNLLAIEALVRPTGDVKELPYAFELNAQHGGLLVTASNGNIAIKPHACNQVVLEVTDPHMHGPYPIYAMRNPVNKQLLEAAKLARELLDHRGHGKPRGTCTSLEVIALLEDAIADAEGS